MAERPDCASLPCDVLLVKPLQQAVITGCDCWIFYSVFAVRLDFLSSTSLSSFVIRRPNWLWIYFHW